MSFRGGLSTLPRRMCLPSWASSWPRPPVSAHLTNLISQSLTKSRGDGAQVYCHVLHDLRQCGLSRKSHYPRLCRYSRAKVFASSTSLGSPLLSPALPQSVQGSSPSPTASATSAPWLAATSSLQPGARPTPTPRQSLESQRRSVSSFSHSSDGTWSGSIARWTKRQPSRTWPWRLSRPLGLVGYRLGAMLWLGGIRFETRESDGARQRCVDGLGAVGGAPDEILVHTVYSIVDSEDRRWWNVTVVVVVRAVANRTDCRSEKRPSGPQAMIKLAEIHRRPKTILYGSYNQQRSAMFSKSAAFATKLNFSPCSPSTS